MVFETLLLAATFVHFETEKLRNPLLALLQTLCAILKKTPMGKIIDNYNKFYKILVFKLNLYNTIIWAIVFLLIGLSCYIAYDFFKILTKSYTIVNYSKIDMPSTGQIGDFVGGVIGTLFAFVSIILLFLTLRNQRFAFSKERFDDRFLEMIRIYRENVKEIEIISPFNIDNEEIINGRKAFKELHRLYIFVFITCRDYCKENKINIDTHLDLPNMVYLLIFYGCEDILQKEIVNNNTSILELKHKDLIKNIVEYINSGKYNDGEILFKLKGVHESFGHYFRHLYQTVKYVHNHMYISDQDKYNYIKLLRAQIGDFEQAFFFYNSISNLGNKWELGIVKEEDKLISRYKLIKNLPEGISVLINPKSYYPKCFKKNTAHNRRSSVIAG